MVGYKRILSAMLSRGVKGSKVNKSPDNNDNTTDGNIATTPASVFSISPHMAHKRERLAHVVTGLGQQYCDTSTPHELFFCHGCDPFFVVIYYSGTYDQEAFPPWFGQPQGQCYEHMQ
ncbi:hypothetical protein A1F94_008006 [Pyrenophora tritici-repentis]|nr:hypothetical protein A1F94_008006 [Pyrenophora tritici-repentis]